LTEISNCSLSEPGCGVTSPTASKDSGWPATAPAVRNVAVISSIDTENGGSDEKSASAPERNSSYWVSVLEKLDPSTTMALPR
jgi:hypothetical protein